MGGEYPGSIWNPSPHFFSGHGNLKVRFIIIHGTAGFSTAQQVANYFHDDNPPTSSHYIIGRDGTIVQCVSESDSAWANGGSTDTDSWWAGGPNPNLYTYSIEHVKTDPMNAEALTLPQQDASFKLVAYLCHKYGIAPRPADKNGGITGHYSIDPVIKANCPGTYPWTQLWQYLGNPANITGAPGGGSISGGQLTGSTSGGSSSSGGGFDLVGALTGLFPFLNSAWWGNFGWNILKIVLGMLILTITLLGLIINIIGSDVLGLFGGSGSGAGKALAKLAVLG